MRECDARVRCPSAMPRVRCPGRRRRRWTQPRTPCGDSPVWLVRALAVFAILCSRCSKYYGNGYTELGRPRSPLHPGHEPRRIRVQPARVMPLMARPASSSGSAGVRSFSTAFRSSANEDSAPRSPRSPHRGAHRGRRSIHCICSRVSCSGNQHRKRKRATSTSRLKPSARRAETPYSSGRTLSFDSEPLT
jgi:hypothetical protein